MGTTLIGQDDFNGEVLLNIFFGGEKRGVCSQLTIVNNKGYTQMALDEMIRFFEAGLQELINKKMDLEEKEE